MSDRLEVTREDEVYVLRSRDKHIKGEICGWGSFGTGLPIEEHPEYYGKDVDPRSPPPGTSLRGQAAMDWAKGSDDDHLWEWRLTDRLLRHLLTSIDGLLSESSPVRLDLEELKAAEHIAMVLRKVIE
jgi:hypothetical protein